MRAGGPHHLAEIKGLLRPDLNGAAVRGLPMLEGTLLTAKHPALVSFSARLVTES
jgi:hypothetical protein